MHFEFGNDLPFVKIISPLDKNLVKSLALMLGAGESEAITLAIEKESPIILDDKKARTVAENMGLHTIGTAGIIIKAKLEGLIPSVKDVIAELENVGFYISNSVKQEALRITSEL